MAKSGKSDTDSAITLAPKADRRQSNRATVTNTDIARRAYDFYLARGCEHGHDVGDWLRAQRELKAAVSPQR